MMFYHQERFRGCALPGFSTCSQNTQVTVHQSVSDYLGLHGLYLREGVLIITYYWFQCWMKPPAL